MNIFTNYIPSKYKSFDDQDPTWMNDHIKSKIQQKNSLFKQYVNNGKTAYDYQNLQFNEFNFQLSQSLSNWTILKTFYSGKKIPLIPPLVVNDQVSLNRDPELY